MYRIVFPSIPSTDNKFCEKSEFFKTLFHNPLVQKNASNCWEFSIPGIDNDEQWGILLMFLMNGTFDNEIKNKIQMQDIQYYLKIANFIQCDELTNYFFNIVSNYTNLDDVFTMMNFFKDLNEKTYKEYVRTIYQKVTNTFIEKSEPIRLKLFDKNNEKAKIINEEILLSDASLIEGNINYKDFLEKSLPKEVSDILHKCLLKDEITIAGGSIVTCLYSLEGGDIDVWHLTAVKEDFDTLLFELSNVQHPKTFNIKKCVVTINYEGFRPLQIIRKMPCTSIDIINSFDASYVKCYYNGEYIVVTLESLCSLILKETNIFRTDNLRYYMRFKKALGKGFTIVNDVLNEDDVRSDIEDSSEKYSTWEEASQFFPYKFLHLIGNYSNDELANVSDVTSGMSFNFSENVCSHRTLGFHYTIINIKINGYDGVKYPSLPVTTYDNPDGTVALCFKMTDEIKQFETLLENQIKAYIIAHPTMSRATRLSPLVKNSGESTYIKKVPKKDLENLEKDDMNNNNNLQLIIQYKGTVVHNNVFLARNLLALDL
jgi:hypothetical protein